MKKKKLFSNLLKKFIFDPNKKKIVQKISLAHQKIRSIKNLGSEKNLGSSKKKLFFQTNLCIC